MPLTTADQGRSALPWDPGTKKPRMRRGFCIRKDEESDPIRDGDDHGMVAQGRLVADFDFHGLT